MKVLIVSPEYPFPPKNGLTIPIANYIRILKNEFNNIDLLTMDNKETHLETDYFDSIFYAVADKSKVRRFLDEIFVTDIYASNFSKKQVLPFVTSRYDLVITSPLSLTSIGSAIKFRDRCVHIAAISDCYTAELLNSFNDKTFYSNIRIKSLIDRLRVGYMGNLESKLLSNSDYIFVQSDSDKFYLEKIGLDNCHEKVKVVTNGVDDSLFKVSLDIGKKINIFGFVADLNVEFYRSKFIWFYKNVWSNLDASKIKLIIHTRKIKVRDKELEKIISDSSVILRDSFVTAVSDIYVDLDVVVAPIFKSYGFINKVGEALAAGKVVIGDSSAYNGIKGFKDGVHGIIANNSSEMQKSIQLLLNDIDQCDSLRVAARALAEEELKWSSKTKVFKEIMGK